MVDRAGAQCLPEEEELKEKRSELGRLREELAQRELRLVTLEAKLQKFEARYLRVVGIRLAELDRIEARIAEVHASLSPGDEAARKRAFGARSRADKSTQVAEEATGNSDCDDSFRPSGTTKRLYRNLAKRLHPDLADTEEERARRNKWMAEVNRAYMASDDARLRAIQRQWESSPERVEGASTGAELVRTIRSIAMVQERLVTIDQEISELEVSPMHALKKKVREHEAQGRQLLEEMAADL